MNTCQQTSSLLENKSELLKYLRRENYSEEFEFHFNQCETCKELFENKLSLWMEKEPEVEKAFNDLNDFSEKEFEEQLTTPFQKEFVAQGFDPGTSKNEILSTFRRVGDFSLADMPNAAGAAELSYIPGKYLPKCDFSSYGGIKFSRRQEGYIFWVESNIPVRLMMIFKKNDKVLCKKEVSDIPEEFISSENIEGWTKIIFERIP